MPTQTRVVRLLQNHIYPTYQLYATMANKQTIPVDGLRLAALTTMEWLRQRMGENAPSELIQPAPSQYREAGDDCLPSLHTNRGYAIDIVSRPQEGVWSLQITEPDLGSEPGNPSQRRQAVPGRIIETNIGFCIQGKTLECGFQTVISDPEGSGPPAEVYRLAVVRRLMENPAFGLSHILPLNGSVSKLDSAAQVKKLAALMDTRENQLPAVVFTYRTEKAEPLPQPRTVLDVTPSPAVSSWSRPGMSHEALFRELAVGDKPAPKATLPYDAAAFAEKMKGFCRTYTLDTGLLSVLGEASSCKPQPGDVVFWQPVRFGDKAQIFPYKPSAKEREKNLEALFQAGYTFPRDRDWDFGHIEFLSAARENLLHETARMMEESRAVSDEWSQKFTQLELSYKAELVKKDTETANLRRQIERLRAYEVQLEKEKDQLAQALEQERQNCKRQVQARDGEVAYLERKLTRPQKHTDVVEWARQQFPDRLIMHKRTETLLAKKTAWGVDIGLLCDALDFLATDYWDYRFGKLPVDEMNRRCSAKYGRPFDVSKLGDYTIEFTPSEYKVKYKMTGTEKAREYALNWHLKVGNDPENLLRIYFFTDDKAQKLVIGSLPEHLRAVQIR